MDQQKIDNTTHGGWWWEETVRLLVFIQNPTLKCSLYVSKKIHRHWPIILQNKNYISIKTTFKIIFLNIRAARALKLYKWLILLHLLDKFNYKRKDFQFKKKKFYWSLMECLPFRSAEVSQKQILVLGIQRLLLQSRETDIEKKLIVYHEPKMGWNRSF